MFTRKDDHKPSTRITLYAWEKCGPAANDEGVSVTGNRMQWFAVVPGISRITWRLMTSLSIRPATGTGRIDTGLRSPGVLPAAQMTTKIDTKALPAGGVPSPIILNYLEN